MAGFSTSVVLLLGAISVIQAQRTCYSCSGVYEADSTEDSTNCFTVNDDTNDVDCGDGECSTEISLAALSLGGRITIERGCQRADSVDDCNECTNPEECLMCCSSANRCNSQALKDILQEKALTQTCYYCRFSEIPGVRSDSGCALNFDGTGLDTVQCPGMCFSASSYIPGIEDIVRGCAYFGNYCDEDYYENAVNGEKERGTEVHYKRSCCMGDNCNSAMTVKAGTFIVMVAIIAGMFATYHL